MHEAGDGRKARRKWTGTSESRCAFISLVCIRGAIWCVPRGLTGCDVCVKNEPKPQQPSGGPSGATSTQLGAKHGLQKFLTPAVLGLDFLAICFSLIAITDREIDENSYSYYVALFFYGLTHVVYLANSFMEDPSTTNLASRLLKNDNFQLLAFAAIFWFSWPWMWSTSRSHTPDIGRFLFQNFFSRPRTHTLAYTQFLSPFSQFQRF